MNHALLVVLALGIFFGALELRAYLWGEEESWWALDDGSSEL